MLIVTTETLGSKKLTYLGMVQGGTVQTVHIGKDIAAGLRTLVGGESAGYNDMMTAARRLALARLEKAAYDMGADAVVGLRFATSGIMQGAAEVFAYGTAVKIEE